MKSQENLMLFSKNGIRTLRWLHSKSLATNFDELDENAKYIDYYAKKISLRLFVLKEVTMTIPTLDSDGRRMQHTQVVLLYTRKLDRG